MTTQPKSVTINLEYWLDMIVVALSIFTGGLIALAGLWLWFDYQTDPSRSLATILSANAVTALPVWAQTYLGNEAHRMGLPLVDSTPAYWYMARASGIVAYLLLWLSTVWGLTLSTKIIRDIVPAPLAYGLHEFLSLTAIVFAALHSVVLLGDEYINFNIFHLAVPFTAPYQPFWTGLGTIAFYLIAALTGSYYIRQQIGRKTWRMLHYLTFAGFVLALVHGLMAGTDTALPVIKLMYLGTGGWILFLTYYRLFTLKPKSVRVV